jgi:mono/diheme cytochrome c family protein
MRARHLKGLATAAFAVAAMAACGGGDAANDMPEETQLPEEAAQAAETQEAAAPMDLPEGVTQEQFTQGRRLFTGTGGCHACHGPDAKGTMLAPDLTDDVWLNVSGRNYDEIVQLINTGVPQPQDHPGPMPPMGGANLSPEEVQALAAYVVGLGS